MHRRRGGGIYTYAPLAITSTDFLSNTGEAYGGGLLSNRSGAITGGRFAGNRTTVAVPGALIGGAGIYNDAGALVISGTAFVGNISAQQGGGLLMTDSGAASFAIAHSSLMGNRADSGAGVEGAGAERAARPECTAGRSEGLLAG